jgi:hypothetical protein
MIGAEACAVRDEEDIAESDESTGRCRAAIASALPLIGCGRRAGANMSIYFDVESDHGTDGAVIVDFSVRVHFRTLVCCVIVFVNNALIESVPRACSDGPRPTSCMAFCPASARGGNIAHFFTRMLHLYGWSF